MALFISKEDVTEPHQPVYAYTFTFSEDETRALNALLYQVSLIRDGVSPLHNELSRTFTKARGVSPLKDAEDVYFYAPNSNNYYKGEKS